MQEVWECDSCHEIDGVINGICPSCGGCQTTPLNDAAKKIAGIEKFG